MWPEGMRVIPDLQTADDLGQRGQAVLAGHQIRQAEPIPALGPPAPTSSRGELGRGAGRTSRSSPSIR